MNKTCKICGYSGENVWRDNKYYCAACGQEIDVTEYDPHALDEKEDTFDKSSTSANSSNFINVTCPVCMNAENNTFENGKCHCSLCGTTFDVNEAHNRSTGGGSRTTYSADEIAALENEVNQNLGCGVICIFLFWPLAIYFFIKWHNAKKELERKR
jgi:ribosomal protein S27E